MQELETLLPIFISKIVQHVKATDAGEASLGPKFEDPSEILALLSLDSREKIDKAFETPLQCQPDKLVTLFDVILKNSVNTWHQGFLDKLYASTNPIGLISDLLLSALNTNSHVFTVSPILTVVEKIVGQKYASLFGFGPEAGGLTFSGGSWSNVTAMHIARSMLFPQTKVDGNGSYKFAVYSSKHSHYSIEKACILLGMGSNAVFKVDVDEKGSMDCKDLKRKIIQSKADGYTPLMINGTAGTTVFGSFDPFEEIDTLIGQLEKDLGYRLWFHIDGSMGGNVIFSRQHNYRLKGSQLSDSITSNPHKMLGVPTTCSFLLLKRRALFQRANSLAAPYLFHNSFDDDENYDLADGTMGCGRRADALKLYLSWLYYGTQGYEERINHGYAIAEWFANKIGTDPSFKVLNNWPLPCVQVCFYYNPHGHDDGEKNTFYTREIARSLHKSGKFLIDYAPNPNDNGKSGEFFRVVFISPNLTHQTCNELVGEIVRIGGALT